jgi:O-antigen/teichoic acid export membrane protein
MDAAEQTTGARNEAGAREEDVLRSSQAAPLVIRGGSVRGAGYALGVLIQAGISVFLLRYLGVVEFGEFVTVISLITIVNLISEAGLGPIGTRELALRSDPDARARLLGNLIGSRIVLTPLGVAAAIAFAVLAGYDSTLVLGTAIAGVGLVLVNIQGTMTLPLSVELRIVALTGFEVARQLIAMVGVAALVLASASLLPFFAVQIPAGVLLLAATPFVLRPLGMLRPRFDRVEWKPLFKKALPVAISLAMNAIYFRVLIILMSLLESGTEIGLYATSFRIFEIAFGIPGLVLAVALPVLATAAAENEGRFAYVVQRMVEVGLIAACALVLLMVTLAGPAIAILGGEEYADAAPLLRIQAFALIPVFLGQICQLGLISIHRQLATAIANGIGLIIVVAVGLGFIGQWGATGAAAGAVVAECVLAGAMLALFRSARPSSRPRFGFLWKPALAAGLAAATLLVPGIPAAVDAVIATAVFGIVIWLTKALPDEVFHAWGLGRLVAGKQP